MSILLLKESGLMEVNLAFSIYISLFFTSSFNIKLINIIINIALFSLLHFWVVPHVEAGGHNFNFIIGWNVTIYCKQK